MKCSKCGYERQSRDDAFVPISECPACGVVYAKHGSASESPPTAAATPVPPHLKPSPVDALSLRKARERVDKKLRERLGTRVQDDRHARTLKLAKRLTSEQIRKRQDEWKQNHTPKQTKLPIAETPAPGKLAQAAQPSGLDKAPDVQTGITKAHETLDAAPVAVEKMTPAGAAPQQPVESATQPVENLPRPADEAPSAEAEAAPADEEIVILDDRVTVPEPAVVAADQETAYRTPAASRKDLDSAMPQLEPATPDEQIAPAIWQQPHHIGPGNGLTRLLPVIAWLILGAGVIGAVLSWTTIGDVEAGVRIPIPESMHTLPLGLLLGFAYLATGVLGFAFFWVSSLISIQLKDIRRLLLSENRNAAEIAESRTEP